MTYKQLMQEEGCREKVVRGEWWQSGRDTGEVNNGKVL